MPKQTWYIASVLSALFVAVVIYLSLPAKGPTPEEAQKAQQAQQLTDDLKAEVEKLKTELAQTQEELAALQEEKKEAVQAKSKLEQEMRAAMESKDITISELQGKLEVNILDRVLFDTGKAEMKPEGADVLLRIANILTNHPNRLIHIIGHTDNIPIRAGANTKYPTNWELSTARALAAVRYLVEKAGVDPHRLAAVGYGEYHPIADNSTEEGRARNRRIALVVLPEVYSPDKELNQAKALAPKPNEEAKALAPDAKDVIGLTEAELRAQYPQMAELDNSFSLLVSKNLHPYHPPATNKLLRFGNTYLVAELKDGKVIALHRISG
ncbi:MAG: OmpA family protein [Verrucomicrobiota bacterium]